MAKDNVGHMVLMVLERRPLLVLALAVTAVGGCVAPGDEDLTGSAGYAIIAPLEPWDSGTRVLPELGPLPPFTYVPPGGCSAEFYRCNQVATDEHTSALAACDAAYDTAINTEPLKGLLEVYNAADAALTVCRKNTPDNCAAQERAVNDAWAPLFVYFENFGNPSEQWEWCRADANEAKVNYLLWCEAQRDACLNPPQQQPSGGSAA